MTQLSDVLRLVAFNEADQSDMGIQFAQHFTAEKQKGNCHPLYSLLYGVPDAATRRVVALAQKMDNEEPEGAYAIWWDAELIGMATYRKAPHYRAIWRREFKGMGPQLDVWLGRDYQTRITTLSVFRLLAGLLSERSATLGLREFGGRAWMVVQPNEYIVEALRDSTNGFGGFRVRDKQPRPYPSLGDGVGAPRQLFTASRTLPQLVKWARLTEQKRCSKQRARARTAQTTS